MGSLRALPLKIPQGDFVPLTSTTFEKVDKTFKCVNSRLFFKLRISENHSNCSGRKFYAHFLEKIGQFLNC